MAPALPHVGGRSFAPWADARSLRGHAGIRRFILLSVGGFRLYFGLFTGNPWGAHVTSFAMAAKAGAGVPVAELSTLPEDDLRQRVMARPVPRHVAVIMDGNGRWATSRGLPRVAGHGEGVKAVRNIVRTAGELGVHRGQVKQPALCGGIGVHRVSLPS